MQREYKISISQEYYSDVVYVSQYDSDYNIVFTVMDKYSKADVDGYTAYFKGLRTDGLGFTFSATGDGNTVTFAIDTTMTAVSGTHTGEIIFYDANGLYFGSANVQIIVEPAAQPDGTIDADTQTAQTIQQEVQAIVDSAAATVTASVGTLSNLTTTDKSSVVAAINEVDANTDTNTTNIATNTTAIGTLANLTTTEKTNLVGAINEIDADVSTLNTDLNTALNDTDTYIEYVLNGTEASANLFDPSTAEEGKAVIYNGNTSNSTNFYVSDYIEVQGREEYKHTGGSVLIIAAYDSSKTFIADSYENITTEPLKYVTPKNAKYVRITDYKAYKSTGTFSLVAKDGIYKMIEDVDEKKIAPGDTTFFTGVPQMFNKDTAEIGKSIIYNGNISSSANFFASDYIPVDPSTDYVYSNAESNYSLFACAFYNSSKTFIADSYTLGTTQRTSPATAAYARITNYKTFVGSSQFEKGTVPTPYTSYGIYKIPREYLDLIASDFVINLPSKIYAIVGTECNIYFDNLIEGNYADYVWDVNCTKGKQLDRKYTIVPAAGDVGSYTLSITASKDGSAAYAETTLIIVGTSAGSGTSKTVMILGDSTTDNDYLVAKLNGDFSDDVMNISTVGTRGTAPNNHEGRGGWSFDRYFTYGVDPNVPSITSDWYNPSTQTFDASYYLSHSGVSAPDWLIINLGINDLMYITDDTQMDTKISDMNDKCDAMITSIKSAMSDTKIGIALTIPPSYTQYPWGLDFGCANTRARYKRNNVTWVANIIERYSGRESERIYVVPIYANLDTQYNMGLEQVHPNARNTDVSISEIPRNGNVHPAETGYWQIADVYYAFIKGNINGD